jgi:hypothetical protein
VGSRFQEQLPVQLHDETEGVNCIDIIIDIEKNVQHTVVWPCGKNAGL